MKPRKKDLLLIVFTLSYILLDAFILFEVQYKRMIAEFLLLVFFLSTVHFFLAKKYEFEFKEIIVLSLLVKIPLVFSTPFLSDDIYRYLWDGFISHQGLNPYKLAPNAAEMAIYAKEYPYHHLINHPQLSTIYLPFVEFSFYVNSFLGNQILGYKVLLMSADVLILFLLKKYSSDGKLLFFYAFHPLVILESYSSAHFEIFFLLFVLLFLLSVQKHKKGSFYLSLLLALVTKAYSLLFLSFKKKWLPFFFSSIAFLIVFSFFFLTSPQSGFGEYYLNFHFNNPGFNFLHAYFFDSYHSINEVIAYKSFIKILVVCVNGILLLLFFKRKRESLQRYILFFSLVVILTSSVIHPWYLLILIPFICLEKETALIFFSYTIQLSYYVLIDYFEKGVWQENPYITYLVFSPLILAFFLKFFKNLKTQFLKIFLS